MTERGLPIVDGAPACPFVAFEDDRDERAASPDHRHRCYAEAEPAPRALAHQEAYCLSSAFPVCPTFQDWARREAARSRAETAQAYDSVAAAATAQAPQRNPPRSWAAPPPWSSRQGSGERGSGEQAAESDWEDEGGSGSEGAPPDVPQRGRGLSGSYADRVASDPVAPGMGREPEYEGGGSPEPELDEDDVPVGEVPPYVPPVGASMAGPRAWDDDEEERGQNDPQVRRRRERDPERIAALGGGVAQPRAAGGGAAGNAGGGPRHERRRDADAPEWERPRPLEAYPTLRSRRLPELSIPPILVAVVALALAAAVLFALPGLLGFGNPSPGGSAAPTTAAATQLVTQAPTAVPQPTDQIYIVQAGDTMSRIASRFEVELADLIAANAETIPNPDSLAIGDQVIIPAQNPDELPAASEIPAAP